MPSAVTLGLFVTTAIAVLVFPGPAVLFIVTRSVEHGRSVGLASVFGVATGAIVHVGAAAFGLSALLVQSAAAFTAVKLVGAAYLIVLGLQRLLRRPSPLDPDADEPAAPGTRSRGVVSAATAYRQGIVVNILNPKLALFFLAFLPQFVDQSAGSAFVQTLVLGFLFIALGVLTDGTYAVLAAYAAERFRRRRSAVGVGSRLVGLVYVALGATTALARRGAATA